MHLWERTFSFKSGKKKSVYQWEKGKGKLQRLQRM